MNNQSEWIKHVNKMMASKTTGLFFAKDKLGKKVILEWIKTDMLSKEYSTAMSSVWEIACQTYTKVEMQFLRAHPEVVGNDAYFKPFEPLFKDGLNKVDWKLVEKTMQKILKQFFVSNPSSLNDKMKKTLASIEHIFIVIKDKKTNKQLGFITFLITPEYAYGNIKCIVFAILPEEQNRGLGKLAMSSILNIISNIKRIFLCTRITNENAKRAYLNWGFVEDKNPVIEEHQYTFNKDHWMFMEYKVDKSDTLQKAAIGLTKE